MPGDFSDIKLGDRFTFNGYPMELIAVGTLRTEGGPIEIIQLQRLIEGNPTDRLVALLKESEFTLKVQSEIIDAALARHVKDVAELDQGECELAILAIEAAMVDEEQLEEQR